MQDNKTHCCRGHEWTPENIYIIPGREVRTCRECVRERGRAYRERRRAANPPRRPRRAQREICTVDGCDNLDSGPIGLCQKHRARLRTRGTVELDRIERPADGLCVVEGCDKPYRTKGMCPMHYSRIQRTGTLELTNPQRDRRGVCVIDGCDKLDMGWSGLCGKHYARQKRNGHPLALRGGPVVKRGAEHPNWCGDDVTYGGVHQRVRKARGVAKNYLCIDCGKPARDWSYDHTDPNQKYDDDGEVLRPYSTDISRYVPRCVPCHRIFDMAQAQPPIDGVNVA